MVEIKLAKPQLVGLERAVWLCGEVKDRQGNCAL
jgi:hypothetical protein